MSFLYVSQEDNVDKLVWKVGYNVDWTDFVTKDTDVGPVPAYISGKTGAAMLLGNE